MSTNDDVFCRLYIDKSSEVFYLIEKIEERLTRIESKFFQLKYDENKDRIYSDISFCFRGIVNDLNEFKKGLRIKLL